MARTKQTGRRKDVMPRPFLTEFVGDELGHGRWKYSTFVDGKNGFFYGIPARARNVIKFNPENKSLETIGPDLDEGSFLFTCGVLAKNGNIYCAPYACTHGAHHHAGFLKISTVDDSVDVLNIPLPEMAPELSWRSGALAKDDKIYFMPFHARRILKLDPEEVTASSVGSDLGDRDRKFCGTVLGLDDCLYGIPHEAKHVIKFDPLNPDALTMVGKSSTFAFECGNGILGNDGCIYAADYEGRILKIDPTKNEHEWIDGSLGDISLGWGDPMGWGDPVVGIDSCIYWPPVGADFVLKFDPGTQKPASLAGEGDATENNDFTKYLGGALARTDGVIYCVPYEGHRILAINPFRELFMTMKRNLYRFPQELGRLFAKSDRDESFYENAVRKFGCPKILAMLDTLLPCSSYSESAPTGAPLENGTGKHDTGATPSTIDRVRNRIISNVDLPLFAIAASCANSHLDVVYHLLRRDAQSLLVRASTRASNCETNNAHEEQEVVPNQDQKKKRKLLFSKKSIVDSPVKQDRSFTP